MKEYTEDLLVTKIFSICFNRPKSITEITSKIYKNEYAKNIVRVFQCCEILMKHGVLIPKFNDRILRFQVDKNSVEK